MNVHSTGRVILPDFLKSCEHCPARFGGVCDNIETEALAALNKLAHHRTYEAGQVIFSESERPDFFANILSGAVKLTKSLADGRQQIVGLQFPPDFLGRAFGQSHACFAEAATRVELCCYPADTFQVLLQKYPDLERRLLEKTLDELDAAREWMVLLGRKTAREKVASFLMLLARRTNKATCPACVEDSSIRFTVPLKRADIADYLGLTIETVSRQITQLRHEGIIETGSAGEVFVPDMAALEDAAGQSEGV